MITAYIGLGSNLQNPVQQIENAILALQKLPETFVKAVSSLYQTKPVGWLDQPDFINAVCELHTELSAQVLLAHLLDIEQDQGRIRNGIKNQPRTLDLDLLLYGNEIIHESNLIIPHPRLQQRAFVLVPLLEIAPDLILQIPSPLVEEG
jgi:2-amino-4-hydroxy-6-hydroxymethyldihydropteridine diphosphokinase